MTGHHPMRLLWPTLAVATLVGAGCRSRQEPTSTSSRAAASQSAQASTKPVDRLLPDELAQGKAVVFGFPVPRDMSVERMYPDAVHIAGSVRPEAVANYVRQRVAALHVEIGAARTVFPAARINGDKTHHIYRIEVIASSGRTLLVIRDITPPPTAQGLTEAERWKRAGLTPDGKIADPRSLE